MQLKLFSEIKYLQDVLNLQVLASLSKYKVMYVVAKSIYASYHSGG